MMKWKLNILNRACTPLLTGLFILSTACSDSPMKTEKTDDGIRILENDRPVLFYQAKNKSLDGEYTRANYIHPLYDLHGEVITEDFPGDHYHHRGIFWTWHQVYIGQQRIGDAWLCEDFIWDVRQIRHSSYIENATIHAVVEWKSPNWKNGNIAFAYEEVKLTVHPINKDYRIIDFDININSKVDSLMIGGSENAKGYGGFSTRIKLPEDIRFFSINGEVQPKTTAVAAGSYMNINGRFDGTKKSGFAIIQHPENPGYVEPWILRSQKSMQNPVYPGEQPILIPRNNPLHLRYRIVLYNGDETNFDYDEVKYQ